MIYSDYLLDICEGGNHRWSEMDISTSYRSIGNVTIIKCINCLAVKVIQKVEQFDGKECIGQKITTTIVEPKEDGILKLYES